MSTDGEREAAPDRVSMALLQVLEDYGWQASTRPARLRAMLNDVIGSAAADNRGAVDALVIAAEESVPAQLAAADLVDFERIEPRLAASLHPWGLDPAMASWAVRAWAWSYATIAAQPGTEPVPSVVPEPAPGPAPAPVPPTDLVMPPADVTVPGDGLLPALFAGFRSDSTDEPTLLPAAAASLGGPPPPTDQPWFAATAGGTSGRRRRPSARLVGLAAGLVVLLGGGTALAVSQSGGSSSSTATLAGAGGHSSAGASGSASSSAAAPKTTASTRATATTKVTTKAATKPKTTAGPVVTPITTAGGALVGGGLVGGAPTVTITKTNPIPRTVTSVAPKPKPSATVVKPQPPKVVAPTASNSSSSYVPIWSPSANAFYVASVAPLAGGTWDTLVVDSVSTSWASAWSAGNKITWQPKYNGAYYFTINWHVVNSAAGLSSNIATLTVTVQCNTAYKCN